MNKNDTLKSIEFIYYKDQDSPEFFELSNLNTNKIKITDPVQISYKLNLFGNKGVAKVYKTVEFFIKVNDKYTVEIIGVIRIGRCKINTDISDVFNKIISVTLADGYAFTGNKFKINDDHISMNIDYSPGYDIERGCSEFIKLLEDALEKYYAPSKKVSKRRIKMNTELILKSTGKEYSIINELIKSIKRSDCIFINKSNPFIHQMEDDSITMSTDSSRDVAIDYRIKDIIKITDISEPKNEVELDISVGIIRLYKTYEFIVSLAGLCKYKIKGKFKTKESKPIASKTMKEIGFDHIREVYEKIESINLIDPKIFESEKFSLKDYKFTILDDTNEVVNLYNIKPIVKRFTNLIDHFYNDGMTSVGPMDSDSK